MPRPLFSQCSGEPTSIRPPALLYGKAQHAVPLTEVHILVDYGSCCHTPHEPIQEKSSHSLSGRDSATSDALEIDLDHIEAW
jgi:hypothetical protein